MACNVCSVAVSAATYAIDKLYDYIIPEGILLKPGMRVEVPFGRGNRKCEGFVLRLLTLPETGKLKAVERVLDKGPVLDKNMIALAAYMCSELFCTFYDCAKAMLPAGLWFQREEGYELAPDASPERVALLSADYPFLSLFLKTAYWPVADLARELGEAFDTQKLTALCQEGILEFRSELEQKVKDKTVRVYALNIPFEDAYARTEKGHSTVRMDIVSCLASEGRMNQQELCYMTGANPAILSAMVKQGILKAEREEVFRTPDFFVEGESPGPVNLSVEQQVAYEGLTALLKEEEAKAAVLFGVTGSGKTQVYIRLIEDTLQVGKSAILLVPEIGLTPQMLSRFTQYFGSEIAVLHSALSAGERYDNWKKIRSGQAHVIIGTRSAVFAPAVNLGVIIIDEEQDTAYKSENSPRYHARDIAKYRVMQEKALLVMGSATPSVETWYGAQEGKYPVFSIKQRYQGAELPDVRIADMRGVLRQGYSGVLGPVLCQELAKAFKEEKQSILFLNRRGNSRLVTCTQCGWTPVCTACSVSMTYHSVNERLVCHYCGRSVPLPIICPECSSRHLKTAVAGTQKVELEIMERFPHARVLRMDADTTSVKNAHNQLLARFEKGEADILLGTQMVTKGLDFENVSLVGVLDADQSLYAQDYRASERAFSLITQVVGRAGRRETQGRAVIQTYSPEHPVLLAAARQDYESFYHAEIEVRRALLCPPVRQIVVLTGSGEAEHIVLSAMVRLKLRIEGLMKGQFSDFTYPVLGPAPAGVVKVNNRYRYHLSVRCPGGKRRRELIGGLLREFARDSQNRGITLFADINPQDL